ncbi:MAG: hypothetical protein IPM74_01205 [Crocinitomicaceae bacterium]|nr:hypothetical protein [Crocinitomicaceae bacterium]MBK8924534.1 hypothetical protein [Crocinitomicaceae bacterium]
MHTLKAYQENCSSFFYELDYYPYGMVMPGRNATNANYRFSFQGQEKDNEIKGDNNSINYKYRMHDPRIGRFFAVDPLGWKYPHNSPYAFSENILIHMVELEGREAVHHKVKRIRSDYDNKGDYYEYEDTSPETIICNESDPTVGAKILNSLFSIPDHQLFILSQKGQVEKVQIVDDITNGHNSRNVTIIYKVPVLIQSATMPGEFEIIYISKSNSVLNEFYLV